MGVFVKDENFLRFRDMLLGADSFPFSTLDDLNSAFEAIGFDVVHGEDKIGECFQR